MLQRRFTDKGIEYSCGCFTPYRKEGEFQHCWRHTKCSKCDGEPVFICLSCEKAFCSWHAFDSMGYCPDCAIPQLKTPEGIYDDILGVRFRGVD